ncbi:nuclear distribution protein nudE homolog [Drosophila kikkawai]|uniref:Nuclear distribution protein nudE homolog n=1 Tax=Drosophila kikkawai TaxID=30033 RepID=A0A6P4I0A9_DROKI|nr:nuclear distribution protein nudE homolog [Drosophila kikkawai]
MSHMEKQLQAVKKDRDSMKDSHATEISNMEKQLEAVKKERDTMKDLHATEISNMEKHLEVVKKERDTLKVYVKKVEQKNANLERERQTHNKSTEHFEMMLDRACEKNALLELELDEKGLLLEKVQRMMDETREFKEELDIKTRNGTDATNSIDRSKNLSTLLPNAIAANGELASHDNVVATNATNVSVSSPSGNENNQQHSLENPKNQITGNSQNRTSQINTLADMIKNLNAMEMKLKERQRSFKK